MLGEEKQLNPALNGTKGAGDEATSLVASRRFPGSTDPTEFHQEGFVRLVDVLPVWARWATGALWILAFGLLLYTILPSTVFVTLQGGAETTCGIMRVVELLLQHSWGGTSALIAISISLPGLQLLWVLFLAAFRNSAPFRATLIPVLAHLARTGLLVLLFVLVGLAAAAAQVGLSTSSPAYPFAAAAFSVGAVTFTIAVLATTSLLAVASACVLPRASPTSDDSTLVLMLPLGGVWAGTAVTCALIGLVLVPCSCFLPLFSVAGEDWTVLRAIGHLTSAHPSLYALLGLVALMLFVAPLLLFTTILFLFLYPRPMSGPREGIHLARTTSYFCLLEILWLGALLYAVTPAHVADINLGTAFWCMSAYVVAHPVALWTATVAEGLIEEAFEADDILSTA